MLYIKVNQMTKRVASNVCYRPELKVYLVSKGIGETVSNEQHMRENKIIRRLEEIARYRLHFKSKSSH